MGKRFSTLICSGAKISKGNLAKATWQRQATGVQCDFGVQWCLSSLSRRAFKMFQSQIVLGKEYMSYFLREPEPEDEVFIAKRRKPEQTRLVVGPCTLADLFLGKHTLYSL